MNREEALHIFSHSEEIVTADEVNASIGKMAAAIKAETNARYAVKYLAEAYRLADEPIVAGS